MNGYQELYGNITSIAFDDYYKYVFTLTFATSRGFILNVRTGGDSETIYRYDPQEPNWNEHTIISIDIIKCGWQDFLKKNEIF